MSLADELLADLDDLGTGVDGAEDDDAYAAAAAGEKRGRANGQNGGGGDAADDAGAGSDDDDDDDLSSYSSGDEGEGNEGSDADASGKAKMIGGLAIEAITKAHNIHAIAKLLNSTALQTALKARGLDRKRLVRRWGLTRVGGPCSGAKLAPACGRVPARPAQYLVHGHRGRAPRVQARRTGEPAYRGH